MPVMVDRFAPSPFAGITETQVRILNSVLYGLPVEIYGGKFSKQPHVYIFDRMLLPDSWAPDPLAAVGDVVLTRADADLLPEWGIGRVMSAHLIERLTVLSLEPTFRACSQCGRAVARDERIHDVASLGVDPNGLARTYDSGEYEWEHRWECARCWEGCWS